MNPFSAAAGPSTGFSLPPNVQLFDDNPDFDLFEWHQNYQSCVRYFLDQAQHTGPIQAVATFINIRLPFRTPLTPVMSSRVPVLSPTSTVGSPHHTTAGPSRAGAASAAAPGSFPHPSLNMSPTGAGPTPPVAVSLTPFIRRLVATGFDRPAILHGFFGDDWAAGIGRLHEAERRNYLFAAKSSHRLAVKDSYDMPDGQYVPFLRPLQEVGEKELRSADDNWSEWLLKAERDWNEWLAMQDWALGPRAPRQMRTQRSGAPGGGPSIKMESDE